MPSWVRDVGRVIRLVKGDRSVGPLHVTRSCWSCRVDFSEPYLFPSLRLLTCKDDQHSVFSWEAVVVQIWARCLLFVSIFVLLKSRLGILGCSSDQTTLPSCMLWKNQLSLRTSDSVKRTRLV